LFVVVAVLALLVFAGNICSAAWGVKLQKRIASRKPALHDQPITPTDFPTKFLHGITKPGSILKKQHFVLYSNGDMNDLWRLNHVREMENFGNRYNKEFGIKFMWTNAGNNSPKQVSDIESLVALNPDLLIVSANESEPLSAVYEFRQLQEVPFITVDRGIAKPLAWTYKDDSYILHISMDLMKRGVFTGKAVVDNYPDIRIVSTRPTELDREKAYETMADWLKKFPAGTIDAGMGSFDEGNLGALRAIKEAGRTELVGPQFGIDAVLEFLENITKGETTMTIETPPYFGGAESKRAILEKHICLMKQNRKDFPLVEWGDQRELDYDISENYPKNRMEDTSLLNKPKYVTDPPIKTS
jgi:ABC-type sugar transport system substrate-binding protein